MTPATFMQRAAVALKSAHSLVHSGDIDGACSRAYYATFNAARAALAAVKAPAIAVRAKTHSGLRASFSQYLVQEGKIPKEFGAILARAEHFRLVADYLGGPISADEVTELLDNAGKFVAAVQLYVDTTSSN